MRMKRIAKATALAVGIGALLAGTLPGGEYAASAKEKKAKDTSKRVCKVVMPTGSRMTTRVCKTRAEWELSLDKTQDGVLQHQMGDGSTYQQAAGAL